MKNSHYTCSITSSLFLSIFLLGCCMLFGLPKGMAQGDTDCAAEFEYIDTGVIYTESGVATFQNNSTGDFTALHWDFGDGSTSTEMADSVSHYYAANGTYTVTLSIWNADQSCFSKIDREITINNVEEDCAISDCVYPGNTNDDEKADLSDLLNIGMGFNATGLPRPNATLDWHGQPAPDWEQETPDGINYKHLDCNGDGVISFQDVNAVLQNYSPMELDMSASIAEGPRAYLQFAADTIYIDDTTPETLTLSAALLLGESDYPMEEVFGVAAHLSYDTSYVQANQGVSAEFDQNSFVAEPGAFLPYAKDVRTTGQIDLAFARLDGQAASGHGRVAVINFVIIVDIIGGRAEKETIFEVPLDGLIAIGPNGEKKEIALDIEPAKVVFISDLTSLSDPLLERQISIFPNPATTQVNINLGELLGQRIHLFDVFGRKIRSEAMSGHQHQLQTAGLTKGIYVLNIETDQGTTTRRVVIE